jgi:hypothetical protein
MKHALVRMMAKNLDEIIVYRKAIEASGAVSEMLKCFGGRYSSKTSTSRISYPDRRVESAL